MLLLCAIHDDVVLHVTRVTPFVITLAVNRSIHLGKYEPKATHETEGMKPIFFPIIIDDETD